MKVVISCLLIVFGGITYAIIDLFLQKSISAEIFNTLLGADIAIVGGLFATLLANVQQTEDKKIADREFASNVLNALVCELEILDEHFVLTLQEAEEHGRGYLDHPVLLTENYLTVFEQNAAYLGRLDQKIAKQIISIYALAKSIFNEYKLNNDALAEQDRILERIRNSKTLAEKTTHSCSDVIRELGVRFLRLKKRNDCWIEDLKQLKEAIAHKNTPC